MGPLFVLLFYPLIDIQGFDDHRTGDWSFGVSQYYFWVDPKKLPVGGIPEKDGGW